MKIKTDFVTNSSSTCYVLSSIVSGMINPPLSGEYEKLKQFYENQEFLYKEYCNLIIEGDIEDIYGASDPAYNMDLQMNDSRYYDEDDNERFVTFLQAKIDLLNPWDYKMENVVKDILEKLLFKQLKETITASQLSYLSYPSSVSGDGWDDGDPQGPSHEYTYRHELHKHETKLGIFTIVNSKIIPEVGNISEALSLNEILLKHINDKGFCLEEQNDKNS